MTHLLQAYIDASRAGNAALAADIADASVSPTAKPTFKTVVLEPVEVIPPVKPPLTTQFPVSIMPRPTFIPTAPFVGDDLGGGANIPWSAGPVSLLTIPPVIGTMLIMIAGRVAVSLAVRGATDLYNGLKLKYHQRNAKLRVHTGVGTKNPGRRIFRDGFDPWLEDGADRPPAPGLHPVPVPVPTDPGKYGWGDDPPEILGGPAFPFMSFDWINTYGPEFGSWM